MSVIKEYLEKKEQLKALKKEVEDLKNQLDTEYFTEVEKSQFNMKKFKEELPHIYGKYTSKTKIIKVRV